MTKPTVVAIMGPTASGKTKAALYVAKHIDCEIISVDSALIYKTMDIGTAKPTKEEQEAVPHHLIDLIDPQEQYSAAKFRQDALSCIKDILKRNKLPLLVGGTMLYFKALINGIDELPDANPIVREQIQKEAQKYGWPYLHKKLCELDPKTAEKIKPNDSQRIERALEVITIANQPLSSLQTGTKVELPFNILPIALEPSIRSQLHEKIEKRFNDMLIDNQLIDEVKELKNRGDLSLDLPSMRCVGYRQTWQYLDGQFDLQTLKEKAVAATRQLCKRQLTWLRSMDNRIVIDCLKTNAHELVLDVIKKHVANYKNT